MEPFFLVSLSSFIILPVQCLSSAGQSLSALLLQIALLGIIYMWFWKGCLLSHLKPTFFTHLFSTIAGKGWYSILLHLWDLGQMFHLFHWTAMDDCRSQNTQIVVFSSPVFRKKYQWFLSCSCSKSLYPVYSEHHPVVNLNLQWPWEDSSLLKILNSLYPICISSQVHIRHILSLDKQNSTTVFHTFHD